MGGSFHFADAVLALRFECHACPSRRCTASATTTYTSMRSPIASRTRRLCHVASARGAMIAQTPATATIVAVRRRNVEIDIKLPPGTANVAGFVALPHRHQLKTSSRNVGSLSSSEPPGRLRLFLRAVVRIGLRMGGWGRSAAPSDPQAGGSRWSTPTTRPFFWKGGCPRTTGNDALHLCDRHHWRLASRAVSMGPLIVSRDVRPGAPSHTTDCPCFGEMICCIGGNARRKRTRLNPFGHRSAAPQV